MKDRIAPLKAYNNPDFMGAPEARILRILSEYIEPSTRLDRLKVNTTVLFLGSARIDPEDKGSSMARYYREAEELAFRLARWAIPLRPKGKNFVVCTGAGPGIMEAANRGAARAGGKTIGMNISLPHEQFPLCLARAGLRLPLLLHAQALPRFAGQGRDRLSGGVRHS
jgi:hypothetical protein